DLIKNKPKVILHNSDNDVWGYKYRDFAPEVDRHIRENYTDFGIDDIWIKNDFYVQALKMIEENIT
ncbi:MAG: hypothetical protein RR797_06180, partial [Christensenella sp.]